MTGVVFFILIIVMLSWHEAGNEWKRNEARDKGYKYYGDSHGKMRRVDNNELWKPTKDPIKWKSKK